MHTLYLLRHAKSSWDDPGRPDRDRPLAPRGVRAGERMARHLSEAGVTPQLVLCSAAVRARQTLELVRPALGGAEVRMEDDLYAAPAGQLLARLHAVPEAVADVLLVGHNPGLQDLALELAARGAALPELAAKFPTGALATLRIRDAAWAELDDGDAELTALAVPRRLPSP
jgi:phosphohistidine phosphatase